jgi:hypothetical protein
VVFAGFLQILASKRGVWMVSCGAFVVNCVAGWGAKFVAKKVPNFFELFLILFAATMKVAQG